MKLIYENYSFNPTSKTVTLIEASGLSLENILLITNVSSGTIIYNFADSVCGGTYDPITSTLTLNFDTTQMNSSDKLQIFVDDGSLSATEQSVVELQEHTLLLRRLLKLLESNATVDSAQRQKVTIDSGTLPTVTTVTTVSTVTTATTLNQLGSVPTIENQIQWSRNLWANSLRNKLEFS
jgi:hypothetical protein